MAQLTTLYKNGDQCLVNGKQIADYVAMGWSTEPGEATASPVLDLTVYDAADLLRIAAHLNLNPSADADRGAVEAGISAWWESMGCPENKIQEVAAMPAPVTPEELEIPFEKPAEEAPTLHVDSHPDGPPADVEAPTEEAPVEEAPTEEATPEDG